MFLKKSVVLVPFVFVLFFEKNCGEIIDEKIEEVSTLTTPVVELSRRNISEDILLILDHYKQNDPVGLPGAPIPDPFPVPPFSHRFQIGRMHFENVKIYGLKKFRIKFMKANLAKMTVDVALDIDQLETHGNYTLSSFFTSAEGPFTVNVKNVSVEAVASMEVQREGILEAQEINMDVNFEDIAVNFENLGFFASMFQGIINTVGDSLFNSIKPFILSEVNDNIRADVNKEIRKIPVTFPNSISPFDQVFLLFRKEIRKRKLDPYTVPDHSNIVAVFDLFWKNIQIFGLSTVHRSGDADVEFKNGSIYVFFEGGTQKLRGVSNWELSLIAGVIGKTGKVEFTVDYFTVKVNASQSLNTDFPPVLEDIQLELGNLQIRFDGAGSLDYLVELGINVIPNLIRFQVMNALEIPVKKRIQEALDQVNLKYLIVENADKINNPNFLNLV